MTLNSYDQTIAAYHDAARDLAKHYDALPADAAFHALHPLFPSSGLALDIGAGSGRDARWLRSLGFDIVAVEPAEGFRAHAATKQNDGIRWLDDRLPSLDRVHRLALSFDLITLSAVWQHIIPDDRARLPQTGDAPSSRRRSRHDAAVRPRSCRSPNASDLQRGD